MNIISTPRFVVASLAWLALAMASAFSGEADAAIYRLTVSKAGAGSGTVTSLPSGISCGSDCTSRYSGNSTVRLTASPASGSVFAGWSGSCSGTSATTSIVITARSSCTATFNLAATRATLTVSKAGTGTGAVTSAPAGINCGATCSAAYATNTSVTLTAAAAAGSSFSGWSGSCSGTAASSSVVLSASKTCVATFAAAPAQYSLAVTLAGTGSGTVTSSPAGISCGTSCSANYSSGTNVTLTAAVASGSTFTGWSGACSGTSAATSVAMTAAKNCTATFTIATPAQYMLFVSPAGNGSGVVTSTPAGISCGATCSKSFAAGTSVSLTAVAASGSTFSGWSGACSGSSATTQIVINATSTCTATYATTAAPTGAAPVVLYTDITSGPNTGGENNKGIYLSIFGKGFGTTGLGTTTRVFINNVEVDNYRFLGASKGRSDIQQITVQVGALGNPAMGVALPIRVSVSGVDSNSDNTFTVNPGNIYFVNNVSGVDTTTTTTGGTFDAPFRTVQRQAGQRISFGIDTASVSGAWGRVHAGDFIVMRGTGTAWTGAGYDNYFLRALNKSGCPLGNFCAQGGGASSGPITLMGYPNEDVFINGAYNSSTDTGTISSADTARIALGMGAWINIVNLRIEGGNHDGAINTQAGGNNWRVVNNDISAATAVNNVNAKAGGIAGDAHIGTGPGQFFLGNNIHDVYNGPDNGTSHFENHGIYIDGTGIYEVAYNVIQKIRGGNGIQTYANGTNDNFNIDNLNFHHNIIQDVGKHGINIADGSRNNIRIWNNQVYDTDRAGIRFNSTALASTKVYNNTFYNTNRINSGAVGALMNDEVVSATAFDLRNNIFVPITGLYAAGTFSGKGTFTNNLWFGGGGSNPAASFSTASLQVDPLFVSTAARNLRLQSGSPAVDTGTSSVSGVVTDDFDISTDSRTSRPRGAGYDMGAFER